jgi:hypothetical protein
MHVSGRQHQDERAAVSIADGVELCVAAAFGDSDTMRQAPPCIIPLAIRKRNGRPEILPPTDPAASNDAAVEAHVLRAVANAWSWRRKLKAGQASTNLDLARTEDISDRHIGRMIKLAYLAPAVVKKLLLQRSLLAVSVKDLTAIAALPWAEQVSAAFGSRGVSLGVQSPPPLSARREQMQVRTAPKHGSDAPLQQVVGGSCRLQEPA